MLVKVLPRVFIYCNDMGENQYDFVGYFSGFIAIGLTIKIVNNKAVILKTFSRKAIRDKKMYLDALNKRVEDFLVEQKKDELLDKNFDPVDEIYL